MINSFALMAVQPNNWAGLFVALGTCLVAYIWIVLLFDWDNPERPRGDRSVDIMRGLFDDRQRRNDRTRDR